MSQFDVVLLWIAGIWFGVGICASSYHTIWLLIHRKDIDLPMTAGWVAKALLMDILMGPLMVGLWILFRDWTPW